MHLLFRVRAAKFNEAVTLYADECRDDYDDHSELKQDEGDDPEGAKSVPDVVDVSVDLDEH